MNHAIKAVMPFTSLVLVGVLLTGGCNRKTPQPPQRLAQSQPQSQAQVVAEPSLDDQIAAVRAGNSDAIKSSALITDADLARIAELPGLRELLLEETQITDAGVLSLSGLPDLEHLRLRGARVDNAGLAHLCQFQKLRILNLPHEKFTDDALAELARLPKLIQLRFSSPNVTDAGMKHLAQLEQLRALHLISVPITDEGLGRLEVLKNLESLYLDNIVDDINVTEAGLVKFLKAVPLHIHIDQQHHDLDPRGHGHSH